MEYTVNFNVDTVVKGHHNYTYRGIKSIKCPFDYALYQMIIFDVKPDLIIEIGTNHGGSSLYLSDMLDIIGKGVIHTIDIMEYPLSDLVKNNKRIKRFVSPNGFKDYDINLANGFNKVLIIDDGSHHYLDVKASLEKFKHLISQNSYFIVEDGILDKLGMEVEYQGGPNKAILEFLSKNSDFKVDHRLCNFFGENATFNTFGYLKKV
jgi:cephalosporin hydroxylase|tara:strand:+ start:116 stop:736 length:621 start_codon:yes stop_codon:yes gene_type:complete